MNWNEAREEYIINSACTYKMLSEKYNVSPTAVSKRAKAEDWRGERKKFAEKNLTEKLNTVTKKQSARYDRILTVSDRLLALAEKTIEIAENADRLSAPLTAQWLRGMCAALKDIKELQGCRADIDIREQTARIKALEHQLQSTDKAPQEITVHIDGEAGVYSE